MRRFFAFTVAALIAFFAVMAHAQVEPTPSAVNLAGEQRMLSQRIAKLYSQIGLNVMPSLAIGQLSVASTRFERNLAALKPAVANSAQATQAFERLASE